MSNTIISVKRDIFRISSRSFYTFLIALIWTQSILIDYFRAILLRLPILNLIPDLIIALLYFVVIVFAFPYMVKNIKMVDVFVFIFIATFYALNYILFPNNKEALDFYASSFLISVVPLYFVGLSFNIDLVKKMLYTLSVISIISLAIYKLVYGGGNTNLNLSNEDMFAAYKLLPHLLIVFVVTFSTPKIMNVLLSGFGVILLFSFGTRGPLICAFLFVMIYFFFLKKNNKKIFAWGIMAVCVFAVSLLFTPIVSFLQNISVQLGMSTRIFSQLLDGTFITNLSGRDDIYYLIVAAIKEKPWFGYGIAGDRTILSSLVDTYSHNIVLEVIVSYGIPIGSCVLIYLSFLLFRGNKFCKTENERMFVLLLFCNCIIKLLFSGTYLNDGFLFLLFGICVGIIRNSKRNIENNRILPSPGSNS